MRWVRGIEAVLSGAIGLCAVLGGTLLMVAPSGRLLGLRVELLTGTPFHDYRLLGGLLFAVIGGLMGLSALAQRRRAPRAAALTVAAGFALVVWLAVQIALLGMVHGLQPALLVGAILLIILGGIDARDRLRAHTSRNSARQAPQALAR